MTTNRQHDHNACRELFAKLSEYIDNELDANEYITIKDHLEACGCCNNCFATLKKTIALCANLEGDVVPDSLSRTLGELSKNCTGI